jgi:hypothetical protein
MPSEVGELVLARCPEVELRSSVSIELASPSTLMGLYCGIFARVHQENKRKRGRAQ